MGQKRHGSDEIISKLRQADIELGKGRKVPEVCKSLEITEQTYYRMASEVRGHAARHVEGDEFSSEGERAAETDGCESSLGYGDPEGGGEGKLVSPERRRRTITEVRRRLGPHRISERRACRVLGQARSTQRYTSLRSQMKFVCYRRCVFLLGNVHASGPSESIGL